MEELKKLAAIVTKRRQKNYPLINLREKNPSKETTFYLMIRNGEADTDEQAAQKLYNSTPDDPSYKMLKSRLRRKLLNQLFFLDYTDSRIKLSNRYEQECYELLYQARILMKENEYKVSERLLQALLRTATEAEFTNIVVSALELLLSNYSNSNLTISFDRTLSKLTHYRKILTLEQEAETYYLTAKLKLTKSVNSRRSFLPQVAELLPRLYELWQETGSYNIYDVYYKVNLWYHELIGDFQTNIRITQETEVLLDQGKLNIRRFDRRYNKYSSVYAHLRAKEYENGLRVAEEGLAAFDQSSLNWFAFMENYFMLAMHARQYTLAQKLLRDVSVNPAYKKVGRIAKERWTLYRAYLYFVRPSPELAREFNYLDMLNAVPEYSKDKLGFNLAILILQFLYFLRAKDTEALVSRLDALKKYEGRHLKDTFSARSRIFFKLMTMTMQEGFRVRKCRSKGRALFEKLADTPTPGDAFAEIEIIPYEQLWELILEIMSSPEFIREEA